MSLIPLYGHAPLRSRLAEIVSRGTLPASLLVHGERGIGKQRLALWLAQLLLCERPGAEPCGECRHCRYMASLQHPDVRWFFPRPRLKDSDASAAEVTADIGDAIAERVAANGIYARPSGSEGIYVYAVRAVVQMAALTPTMAARKVIIIGDAERMVPQESSPEAANAFLKLLEEPPADTTIILTSSEPGALLPTIRSRVVGVRAAPLGDADLAAFAADPLAAKALGRAAVQPERLRAARGAPGSLIAFEAAGEALAAARELLDAAAGGPGEWSRVALKAGVTGARGFYSDMLDALGILLGERQRAAAERGDAGGALAAGRAIEAVEQAREHAMRNASPQLLSAALAPALAAAS